MMQESVIATAVSRGILSADQADALNRLAAELGGESQPAAQRTPDDEALRLITGFADIFVTLGLVLFLGAVRYIGGALLPDLGLSWLVLAIVAWLLAEFFTRRRRMALPSIVLLAVFVGATFLALLHGFAALTGDVDIATGNYPAFVNGYPMVASVAALATSVAAFLHYLRFRVPITVAAGVVALAGALLAGLLAAAPEIVRTHVTALLFVLGLAIFVLAMRFDMSDKARLTRRTDVAFWLHLAAAPMIVHPLFAGIGADFGVVSLGQAVAILGAFLALGIVAVIIDRRAILVSGLIYAGIACGTLLRNAGASDLMLPATLLVLGAFILLLSAGWQPLRRLFLRGLPVNLTLRLPNPVT
ncbi:MAG: hypothetical protein KF735_06550 [Chelatococcus sp.]|uniref:hypothetical protein n=1 Tax=unclassified Chelatococcus TaxID=2638111 RepID=UPI001BCCB2D0|nr:MULTISPECIES: hypothetical protein [unclassified Chelatococcus]CAH1657054.1 conserved membrane hypothetical protein [Hyphomicrobiales bacterium]MBS7740627.1 hypothetical protein [Chelatococcus sp. HY11]MBX3537274.1 hypothetical protein [Chelatococcus sp.]MBX3544589.1 hypothetical protein [Chelatococcus sp.]MCO5079886.1 hypothetical protein [Chelatococcus sp.]